MQLTDKDGNVFGSGGLEITTSDGKPKVPVINTDITIGTTAVIGGVSGRVLYNNAGVVGELDLSSIYVPTSRTLTINGVTQDLSANRTFTISTGITIGSTAIASGVVGRVLFEGAGNVVQESSGLTYNDTAKAFTLIGPVGSIIQHTALTNYNGLGGLQLNVADGTERAFFKLNPTSGEVRIGATGSGYFPTFYAQGVEAMRIFASTRNVAINTTTDAGFRLDVNGTARIQSTLSVSGSTTTTGIISANGGISAGILGYGISTIPTNTIFFNDTTRVIQSPATWIWHDLFAFNRYSATYEVYNGTLWTPAAVNIELFAQKQSQSISVITSTILGSRWTFNNTAWGSAQWLVIGVSWSASLASISVLVETYDGTAWITRHTSNATISANNYFAYVSPYAGDNQMRITITKTGGGNDLNLSNIKLLTSRPGDQGVGSEVEVPYYWSGNRNMGIGGLQTSNTKLTVTGTADSSGGIAAGQRITGQINATANNDVLIGLDIQPTFTPNAFTGVTQIPLRIGSSSADRGITFSNQNWMIQSGTASGSSISFNGSVGFDFSTYAQSNTPYRFLQGYTIKFMIAATTGNVLINTSTDSGFKLDVNGSARVQSGLTVSGSLNLNSSDISSAWIAYTPTWSTDGATQPSLGNGTITGAYKVIGKTVFVRVRLVFGTTTTAGTGTFYFSLPVNAAAAWGVQMPASILDNGNAWYQATVNGEYGGLTDRVALIGQSAGGANSSQGVTGVFPIGFGNTDSIQFGGSYESI